MKPEIAAELRTLEERTTIAVRLETAPDRLAQVFDTELPRVAAVMGDVAAEMAGPPFARYHHYGPDRVLQPISGRPDGVIGSSSLPGGLAAVAFHLGPYDTLSETYDGLASWMTSEGHTAGDGPWEVYLSDPSLVPDPADWETEVIWPIRAAGQP